MKKPKKEEKKLTVKEIKELQPLAEVYELSEFRKYIVFIKKPSIIGMDNMQAEIQARELARVLQAAKVKCYMMVGVDINDVKFLEIS